MMLARRAGPALIAFALACHPAPPRATPPASPLAWPPITRDVKPWTRWWWLGSAVDKPNLTAQVAELAAAGFGGVEVTVIYGAKGADSSYIPYLTPRWVEMIAHTAAEAHRHGMGLDLPQGSGWRTGGPTVLPADANASLAIRVDSVVAGETWAADLTGHRVNAIVAVSGDGQRVDIPAGSPAGVVRWQAPAGRWTIYVAETRFSGDNVKRPAPGGEGPSIDPFSATATARYLAMFGDRMASVPRGAIRSYFHDSFEYTGNASANLFDVFRQRRGYDLATELPALTGRGDGDHVARVLSDYRQTLDEMLLENFVEQLTSWSHARGSLMREQAHGSPGNLLDLYAASDIPETEIFGVLGGPDGDPLINKFASSAAHVAGRRLASAESFTWLGEHFSTTLNEIKQAADRMFLAGINHLVYHGTAYSPSSVAWPGWQFYASVEFNSRNAFWRDLPAFNRYVSRVQSVLQAGEPDSDVLLYWPIWDNWHDPAGRSMDFKVHNPVWFHGKPFGKLARTLHESGYAVDYVSDRQIAQQISVAGGRLRAHGSGYSALIVPAAEHMPPETFTRLSTLVRDGATVIFVGALPSDVPGLARLAERRGQLTAAMGEIAWGTPNAGVRSATLGKGRMLAGDQLEPLLAAAGVRRDPLAEQKELRIIRRQSPEGRYYFVVAAQPVDRWLPLAGHPASVAFMDPMSGQAALARLRTVGERTEAYVQLDSGQSMILRTIDRAVPGAAWPYARSQGAPVALRGTWSVSFVDGAPVLPKAFTSDSLVAWTGRGDDEADRFAGAGRYTVVFDAPDTASRNMLSLGRVAESARVTLNGQDLGVLFASPFRVETGPLRRTGNVLEVEVANVSANRIRDLDRRGVLWKNFRDINFVSIDYRPFDASRWPVRTSGLLGPVTLQPLSTVDEFTRPSAGASQEYFSNWPAGTSPQEVGRRLSANFLARRFELERGLRPTMIYPEIVTWYGALNVAKLTGDTALQQRLIRRFDPYKAPRAEHINLQQHVDFSVFGAVPLEIYLQTRDPAYLSLGKGFADRQWATPSANGITSEARYWVDDMYMVTVLQTQAFRATRDRAYLDRNATVMVAYLDSLHQPNGLLHHGPGTPFFWGRGNGWIAAGMSELLYSLPADHPLRPRILAGYRKTMATLLQYQSPEGLWRQLVDKSDVWLETSGSGMFTFAMVTGVKQGWLDATTYGPAARKAWLALVGQLEPNGDMRGVSVGTNIAAVEVGNDLDTQYKFYLARERKTGDLHGQAPVLWAAMALMRGEGEHP